MTGRDYGIDMLVELFESGRPLGSYLLLQIKGTTQRIPSVANSLSFDMPVRTLRYAELFVAPVLLALCPVELEPPVFYYLWLQEYTRIVLDFDSPGWRRNTSTVRVTIPIENRMPGREGELSFMSRFPKRLFDWAQTGRIAHELSHLSDQLHDSQGSDVILLREMLRMFEEIRNMPGIFGDLQWPWAQHMKNSVIEPAIRAVALLSRGGPYTAADLQSLGWSSVGGYQYESQDDLQWTILSTLGTLIHHVLVALAIGNDYGLARTLWETEGSHDF